MERENATERVYQYLRSAILDGQLVGGTRLKEVALADELATSRTPVREALVRLQRDGLVTVLPNRGTLVRLLTEHDIEDAFQLRALLEGFAAAQAASRLTPEQTDALDRLCDEMEEVGGTGQSADTIAFLLDRNDRFHAIIVEASGNQRLPTTLRAGMEIPRIYRTYYWYPLQERQRSFVYHRELVEAFRRRDTLWAEAAMKSHVHAARDFLVAKLREENALRLAQSEAAS